jgi:hypothetical protein
MSLESPPGRRYMLLPIGQGLRSRHGGCMSRTNAIDGVIGSLHGGRLAKRWSAVRARVSAGRLDLELANGADPWSSKDLMLRAARMSSLAERRKLAAGFTSLVGQARRSTSFDAVQIRSRLVLEHADQLLLLASRLRQLDPVDVVTLAEVGLLLRDGASPVYVGGSPPEELMRVIARALQELDRA